MATLQQFDCKLPSLFFTYIKLYLKAAPVSFVIAERIFDIVFSTYWSVRVFSLSCRTKLTAYCFLPAGILSPLYTSKSTTLFKIFFSAVNAAFNALNKELLSTHINTCVIEDIKNGNNETVDELVLLLQRLMK